MDAKKHFVPVFFFLCLGFCSFSLKKSFRFSNFSGFFVCNLPFHLVANFILFLQDFFASFSEVLFHHLPWSTNDPTYFLQLRFACILVLNWRVARCVVHKPMKILLLMPRQGVGPVP